MSEYSAKVIFTSKEVSVRDRVHLKDTGNYVRLDESTQLEDVIINLDYYAIVEVHNEKAQSGNKDYQQTITVDKDGTYYSTGSSSYLNALENIINELEDEGDTGDISIRVYRRPSKNRAGKDFITCSLV
jgi:hypothetical protein